MVDVRLYLRYYRQFLAPMQVGARMEIINDDKLRRASRNRRRFFGNLTGLTSPSYIPPAPASTSFFCC